jgi:hypothetical protein
MNEKLTFEEIGIVFTEGKGCKTCQDNSCHNIVPLKSTGEEFNVHVSTNQIRTKFRIHASSQSNTSIHDEISEEFKVEKDAVKFICETFQWFNCF